MSYFNPPVTFQHVDTRQIRALDILGGRAVLVDDFRGPLTRWDPRKWVLFERTPVTGWLMEIIYEMWLQYAHETPDGGLSSGGLDALDAAEDALRTAGGAASWRSPRKSVSSRKTYGTGMRM